jgi:hypothetical protein
VCVISLSTERDVSRAQDEDKGDDCSLISTVFPLIQYSRRESYREGQEPRWGPLGDGMPRLQGRGRAQYEYEHEHNRLSNTTGPRACLSHTPATTVPTAVIDMSSIKVYSDDPSNDAYQHDFLAFRPMMEIASDTYSLIVTRNPRTDSSLSDEQVRCLKDTVRAELESTSTTSIASKMCRSWPNLFLGVVNQTTNDGVYEEFDELAHEIAGRVMSDGSLKNIPYEVMTPEYNHHGKLGLSIRVSRKARSLVSVGHPSPSP